MLSFSIVFLGFPEVVTRRGRSRVNKCTRITGEYPIRLVRGRVAALYHLFLGHDSVFSNRLPCLAGDNLTPPDLLPEMIKMTGRRASRPYIFRFACSTNPCRVLRTWRRLGLPPSVSISFVLDAFLFRTRALLLRGSHGFSRGCSVSQICQRSVQAASKLGVQAFEGHLPVTLASVLSFVLSRDRL